MRKSYLESYYNIIPKTQQNKLLEIIKNQSESAGENIDQQTLQARLQALITEIEKPLGSPLITYRPAQKYGKIVSEDYNNMMNETYTDLGALFKQNNTIGKTIKVHELLNDAVLRDVRAAARKVENDIVVYKAVKENKTGITDAKFNTFYKDDNQVQSNPFKAFVDTDTNSLKLAVGDSSSALNINGLAMADIAITHYGGGIRGTLETEEHRKEKAIDESLTTFWGEVILTDEPIQQFYNGATEFGAIAEIVITLFRAESINHIKYIPFSNYPLGVIAIYYRSKTTDTWTDLAVTRVESTDAMEFNFSEVLAKEIKIVINQKNASINVYKIPRRIISNAQLWQQIVDREYSISTQTIDPIQATQDMIDSITGWRAYLDANIDLDTRLKDKGLPQTDMDMSENIFDATTETMTKAETKGADALKVDLYGKKANIEDELVEVRKYEYVYGAYNIDVKRVWYLSKGEYISPRYSVNGAVVQAELAVTEIVPSGTSIEYQVSTRPNEWVNILPSGTPIEYERLDIDPLTRVGITRFDVDGSITAVYRNEVEIPSGDYTFNASTNEITISDYWYVSSAVYKTSYTPENITGLSTGSFIIDFSSDALSAAEERFVNGGMRQYKVDLAHYPYIDFRIINDTAEAGAVAPGFLYEDGRWKNISGGVKYGISNGSYYDPLYITVDGFVAENLSDYYEDERPALSLYNVTTYPDFNFFHVGRSVYLNADLTGREVKVIYYYLNDYIQFRSLLRKNNKSDVTTTPVLQDYTLKLRTI